MWGNYLTVALRALVRDRMYAFINIFGLAVGLAACLILLLYVRYESSYDDWLPDADRDQSLNCIRGATILQMAAMPCNCLIKIPMR